MNKIKKFIGLFVFAILALAVFSPANAANANVNNFSFESFKGEYRLNKDENGRAVMKVTENLVATFPDSNQNRGIERAIPLGYDGHKVFDGKINVWRNGEPENIADTDTENGVKVFRLGRENQYVQGRQEYKIEYTLTDVIKNSGDYQEIYWNTNGTQWSQPFGSVEAKLILDESVVDNYADEAVCYAGQDGSSSPCDGWQKDSNSFTFSHGALGVYNNLTFAVKFKPGSFVDFKAPTYLIVLVIAVAILLVVAFGYVISIWVRAPRSAKINRAIVPQYTMPTELTNLLHSQMIYSGPSSNVPISAVLLDLAVSGYIKIIESDTGGKIFGRKQYSLELINRNVSSKFYGDILNIFFPANNTVYELKTSNETLSLGLAKVVDINRKDFLKMDYFQDRKILDKMAAKIASVAVFGSVMGLMAAGFGDNLGSSYSSLIVSVSFGSAILLVVGLTVSIVLGSRHPLSEKGAEIKHHLTGLKMYMELAEADRLKYLQSVQGAERVVSDGQSKIKLYEKLLPYAAIFGLEKSWLKVLEVEYANYDNAYSPDWYSGRGAFNAMVFANSVNNFSSSVNIYTAPSSSSSGGSSFSGGGGSSGGGGGGGGGGGW